MIGAILGGVGAATSIAGGLFGGKKAKKAAKKQKKIAQEQARIAGLINEQGQIASESAKRQFGIEQGIQARQARLTRIEAVREARIRRAQIVSSASGAGVGLGGMIGAAGALTSQFLGQQSGFNLFERMGQQSANEQKIQLDAQGKAAELEGQIRVLGGQSQITDAKMQQGMATGNLISNIGNSIFQVGNQFGGFNTTPFKGV